MFSPIHHTFGPHATPRHVLDAVVARLRWPFGPLFRGKAAARLEQALGQLYDGEAVTFASGREGMLALLRAMNLLSGEEVILQGYTCMVLPNAIHAAGGVPVYADLDRETLNVDLADVERRVTPRTRAIVCQHTFGIPGDGKALRALCDKHGILLIEDCAHVLPDTASTDEICAYGDALLLSFGRDKAISGVAGGAMVCREPALAAKVRKQQEAAGDLPWLQAGLLLDYPVWYWIWRPLYGIGIGKAAMRALAKLGMLAPVLSADEKHGNMPAALRRMPDGCAELALKSLARLREINDHRRALTAFYHAEAKKRGWPVLAGVRPELPLQKYPLFVKNAGGIRAELKKRNVYLDDGWTGCVICPGSSDLVASGYEPGSDPEAEAACEMILSLPTHPTMSLKEAKTLVAMLDPLLR
jgi:perosamine synthetase